MAFAKRSLAELGGLKINLRIMEGNASVGPFFLAHGYRTEKRIRMGKRLPVR